MDWRMWDGMGWRGQVVGRAEVTRVRTWSGDRGVKKESEGDEDEVDGKVVIEGGLENEELMSSIFFVK